MDAEKLVRHHEMKPQTGASFILKKNEYLKVITPHAHQVSDLYCVSLSDSGEKLSTGRTLDYNDTIFISTGHQLFSNRSSAMLTILEDTCGRHDLLMTPCSLKMFQIVAGNNEYHPSCHENLWKSMQEFGVRADDIDTTFNIFMNVQVAQDGKVSIHAPLANAGDSVTFKAEMDLIIGLTACSHEETNAGSCKPILYQTWS